MVDNEEIISYLATGGWSVDVITGNDSKKYNVIHGYEIPAGTLAGRKCELAFERTAVLPYVFPSAIHSNPRLVPMDQPNRERYHVTDSGIGQDWQYFSRRLDKQPTPRNIVSHIATIFREI